MKNEILGTDEYAVKENKRLKQIEKLENISYKIGPDVLGLKWGQIKHYDFTENPDALEIIKKYYNEGVKSSGLITDSANDNQKQFICDLIDITNGCIYNDWDGDYYTKNQAKKYILEYIN